MTCFFCVFDLLEWAQAILLFVSFFFHTIITNTYAHLSSSHINVHGLFIAVFSSFLHYFSPFSSIVFSFISLVSTTQIITHKFFRDVGTTGCGGGEHTPTFRKFSLFPSKNLYFYWKKRSSHGKIKVCTPHVLKFYKCILSRSKIFWIDLQL